MPEFKTLRGMRDLIAQDARMMIYNEDVARKVARLYGYEEVITPVVELYELLAAKAGEEVRSRMFVFKDLGGRHVALRPEFTASIARLVATTMRNEPKPFRLFCMGTVYRYDEPQRGRYREIWQSDYELVGSDRPEGDAEVIMLTDRLMREVGLKSLDMKVGHVGIIRGMLSHEGVGAQEQSAIMQLMDKKQYDAALKLVEGVGVSQECMKLLGRLIECRGKDVMDVANRIEELVRGYEKSVMAVQNLREILELVSNSGHKINFTVDAGFARGLEYYTGMIYEVYVPDVGVAVAGGGRYDKLVELFGGEPTPAVGVAHGMDRMMLAMKIHKIDLRRENRKSVFVVPVKEELRAEALKISQMLRNAGILVEFEVMGRRVAKVLEDADRRNMDYAIIVGERELGEGAVVVRDLAKRRQSTVRIDRIIDAIES